MTGKFIYRLFLLLLVSAPVFAQGDDWATLNRTLTRDYVIPGYQQLAASSELLAVTVGEFCAAPDQAGFDAVKTGYHQAMDAWQSMQHLNFGPVIYFNWQYRIQYWPDDNGTGGRQLSVLLEDKDSSLLEPDVFAEQSVGIQGFPAFERLVYEDDALNLFSTDNFRCELLVAIADNIAGIGEGISQRWQEEFNATVLLEDDTAYFESLEDASIAFVKPLVESVRRIQQDKLVSPLGESFEGFRERRAESWRSSRSLRNIRFNVDSLSRYFHGDASNTEDSYFIYRLFPDEDVAAITQSFSSVRDLLQDMPDSLTEQAATEAGYAQLITLEAELDALFEALEAAVKNTDLYLGFNSLDGD